jgi:hypothetical protein
MPKLADKLREKTETPVTVVKQAIKKIIKRKK